MFIRSCIHYLLTIANFKIKHSVLFSAELEQPSYDFQRLIKPELVRTILSVYEAPLPVHSHAVALDMMVEVLVDGCATVVGAGARTGISSDNALMRSKVDGTMIRFGFILKRKESVLIFLTNMRGRGSYKPIFLLLFKYPL